MADCEVTRKDARKKSGTEKQGGLLMKVIKSSWYTIALITFLFAGAVIFMGIEGNHEEFKNYKLLEERQIFSAKLRTVGNG